MLERLKALNSAGYSALNLDEAVAMLAHARNMREIYENEMGEAPAWLNQANKALTQLIHEKNRDSVERELAETKRALEGLKTPGERKVELQKKAKRLQERLGSAA